MRQEQGMRIYRHAILGMLVFGWLPLASQAQSANQAASAQEVQELRQLVLQLQAQVAQLQKGQNATPANGQVQADNKPPTQAASPTVPQENLVSPASTPSGNASPAAQENSA